MLMRALLLLCCVAVGCAGIDEPGRLVPGTVDDDPSLPSFEVPGTRLWLRALGEPGRPLIVVLPGGPGADSAGLMRLAPLAENHRVVFYDQRGCGLSRRHAPGAVSLAVALDDLDAVITAFAAPGERVTLVGHSWGGMLATAYVQRSPNRVAHAVLIEPGPFTSERWNQLGLGSTDLFTQPVSELIWSEAVVAPETHARLDLEFQLATSVPEYHMATDDPMPFRRLGWQAYRDIFAGFTTERGALAWNFTAGLERYEGDFLYLQSSLNTLMNDAYVAAQVADLPRARVVKVEGAGHDLPWVKAAEVVAAVDEVSR